MSVLSFSVMAEPAALIPPPSELLAVVPLFAMTEESISMRVVDDAWTPFTVLSSMRQSLTFTSEFVSLVRKIPFSPFLIVKPSMITPFASLPLITDIVWLLPAASPLSVVSFPALRSDKLFSVPAKPP